MHSSTELMDVAAQLTDEGREQAIQLAGQAVERHMEEFTRSGCFSARGAADQARLAMEYLIRGRSPEQVARMQAEQAQRMACEPGAKRGAGA